MFFIINNSNFISLTSLLMFDNHFALITTKMFADDPIVKALFKALQPLITDLVRSEFENNNQAYQLKNDDDDDMSLTRDDVADKLKISTQTVHNYTHSGLLKYRFVGNKYLYSKAQIKEFSTNKPKRKNRKIKT